LVSLLNKSFENGASCCDFVEEISQFQKPIIVDFNNVLVNNCYPLVLNPDAPQFLKQIQSVGNVFIVTTAMDWTGVKTVMENFNIWNSEMILLTYPNYQELVAYQTPKSQDILKRYLSINKERMERYTREDFLGSPAEKRISPIFMKQFDVPLIDDVEEQHKTIQGY
jgi:hypothetical protein